MYEDLISLSYRTCLSSIAYTQQPSGIHSPIFHKTTSLIIKSIGLFSILLEIILITKRDKRRNYLQLFSYVYLSTCSMIS